MDLSKPAAYHTLSKQSRYAWKHDGTLEPDASGEYVVSPSRFFYRDVGGTLYVAKEGARVIPLHLGGRMVGGRRTYVRGADDHIGVTTGGRGSVMYAIPINQFRTNGQGSR